MDFANRTLMMAAKTEGHPGNCTMIVVTDSAVTVRQDCAIKAALLRSFAHRSSYYLLSLPSLALLCQDGAQAELVADDVLTAAKMHHVDKLLVASMTAEPRTVIRKLREARPALGTKMRIKEQALTRPRRLEGPECLVIACRDWRLQYGEGCRTAISAAFGIEDSAFMGTSGGPKELARDTPRRRMVLAQIPHFASKGLRRVILLSHTDCGMYGGDRSFASTAAQRAALERDLAPSAAAIAEAFPRLHVDAGIIWCSSDGVEEITPVGSAARSPRRQQA